jgi:hypothetical protein
LLAAREGDVALVEEVIDVRRQQQAVRAIESLRVGRMSPRLDVTGFEVPRLVDAGHSTGSLAQQHVRPEHALAPSDPTSCSRNAGGAALDECWNSDIGTSEIDRMPCVIRLLKIPSQAAARGTACVATSCRQPDYAEHAFDGRCLLGACI